MADEHPEPTEPTDGELWNQLGHAVSLDTSENQVVWTIFGLFWAADAIILVALFTTGDVPKPAVGAIVSAVGVVLSAVWYLIQKRAIGYLEFYDGTVERLERRLRIPPDLTVSGNINARHYQLSLRGSVRIRGLMNACAGISAALWAASSLWFLCRLTSGCT